MELKGLAFVALLGILSVHKSEATSCDDEGWCCGSGKCYKVFCGDKDWTEACHHCLDLGDGYDIASIHSMDQQLLAVEATQVVPEGTCPDLDNPVDVPDEDDFWIGLHTKDGEDTDDPDDDQWAWTDNSDYDFKFWAEGEPDETNAAYIDGDQRFRWDGVDKESDSVFAWICQRPHDSSDSFTKMFCFHPNEEVRVKDSEEKIMVKDIKPGDKVLSIDADGGVRYDEVYAIAHKDLNQEARFVEIVAGGDKKIRVTGQHELVTQSGVRRASAVTLGELLYVYDEGSEQIAKARVTRVTRDIPLEGVINVFTKSGHILVSDVLAGEYVGPYPAPVSHLALYPARMVASLLGEVPPDDKGWTIWLGLMYNMMKFVSG